MTSGAYVLMAIGIEDTAGNVLLMPVTIFFGAVEVDTTKPAADVIPPSVVSSTPADGQSVKTTGSFVVRFDEEVDVASAQSGIVVSGVEGTVDVTGAVAIFKPQEPMKVGEHILTIVGIKDLAGNVMESSLLIPFEVIAPPTTGRPSNGRSALAANPNAAILFMNSNNQTGAGGESIKGSLLANAGYKNVTEVNTFADFKTEWAKRRNYDVIIISYHGIQGDAELQAWVKSDGEVLKAWVKGGGAFLSCAGRDDEEADLAALFGLTYEDTGATEDFVPMTPSTPFARGIANNKLDATNATDPTPWQGDIYKDPLPNWVIYVVTTDSEGRPTMVAGHYGNGALALGGFEFTNVGTAGSVSQEEFIGFPTFWKNLMDWVTGLGAAVSNVDKLATAWGIIKSE
jgi:hypothetical protein